MVQLLKMLVVIALVATGFSPQPDFHVDLTVLDSEESEDSNSVTETLTIDGYKGSYHRVYEGYHPNDDFDRDRKYSFRLSEEELQELTLLIQENGLMLSREDTLSTGDWWSSFDVSWEIILDGQNARGHVVGEALPYAEINADDVEDEAKLAAEKVMSFVQNEVGFND